MSWMDSWSRPSKSQAAPPPFYLTSPSTAKYCHTCGRIIGARRAQTSKASTTEVKYCSDKCKKHKPSTAPDSLDVRIEKALGALLEGLEPPPLETGKDDDEVQRDGSAKANDGVRSDGKKVAKPSKKPPKKGDPRIIVQLSAVEEAVFGNRQDPEKTYGRRRNKAFRGVREEGEWKSVDMVDKPTPAQESVFTRHDDHGALTDEDDTAGSAADSDDHLEPTPGTDGGVSLTAPQFPLPGSHVRPSQLDSDVNFSAGGGERGHSEKITETAEMLAKRREGQKKAEEKELVRCVVRRAVVFGLEVEGDGGHERKAGKKGKKSKGEEAENDDVEMGGRKCEALMGGSVVEPSFAKGGWSVRWRED